MTAMDKEQFLNEQSDDAKAAMRATLKDVKNEALHFVDPRGWAKTHPWKSVAAAAVTGFIAGEMLRRPAAPAAPVVEPEMPPSQPKRGSLLVSILKRATRITIALAQPFLAELWNIHTASRNGDSQAHNPSQSPTAGPSTRPHRP
jgi:hypothetical protein